MQKQLEARWAFVVEKNEGWSTGSCMTLKDGQEGPPVRFRTQGKANCRCQLASSSLVSNPSLGLCCSHPHCVFAHDWVTTPVLGLRCAFRSDEGRASNETPRAVRAPFCDEE